MFLFSSRKLCLIKKYLTASLFIPFILAAQETKIGSNIEGPFSIDTTTGSIYYKSPDPYSPLWRIMKTDQKGENTEITEFEEVPIFANHSRKLIHFQITSDFRNYNVYERNMETGNDRLLYAAGPVPQEYSPDDKYLFLRGGLYNFETDSLTIYEDERWNFPQFFTDYQWSGNTTIVSQYNRPDTNYILEFNLINEVVDTILIQPTLYNWQLTAYGYNLKYDLLTVNFYEGPQNFMHLYEKREDTLIFVSEIETILYEAGCVVTELKWSHDNEKLAILGDPSTISAAGLYIYSLENKTLYEVFSAQYYIGRLSDLKWFDNEKVLYVNYEYNTLNIYNIRNIVSVEKIEPEVSNNSLLIENFPNPFNPSTKIKYTIPESGIIKITIYDMLGRKITDLIDEYHSAGEYEINFDAGKYGLSSGNYIYSLKSGENVVSKMFTFIK